MEVSKGPVMRWNCTCRACGMAEHLHLESLILPLVCTIKIYNRIRTIYIIDRRLTANVDHLSCTVLCVYWLSHFIVAAIPSFIISLYSILICLP